MYIPSVGHTARQLRYKFDYLMIDMRRWYYGQLRNPRVVQTRFKGEVLMSLRIDDKPRPAAARKFLRLRRSPTMDLDSVINMYYDDDMLAVQEEVSERESLNIWDGFLDLREEGDSAIANGYSGVDSEQSEGIRSAGSDAIVDVDFLSAWLADSGVPGSTPPTTVEEIQAADFETGESPKMERKKELQVLDSKNLHRQTQDIWAQTYADAKVYFRDSPVGCKLDAQE